MVIDSDNQVIYVSGGRITEKNWETLRYSDMYSYEIRTSRWDLIK